MGHKLSSLVDHGHESNHLDDEGDNSAIHGHGHGHGGGHANIRNERGDRYSQQHQKDDNGGKDRRESAGVGMNDMHAMRNSSRGRVMGHDDGEGSHHYHYDDYVHIDHGHNNGSMHNSSGNSGGVGGVGVDQGSDDISYLVSRRLQNVADQLSLVCKMQNSNNNISILDNSSGRRNSRGSIGNDDHSNLLLQSSIKKIRELADVLVYRSCIDDYDVMVKEDDRALKAL